MIKAVKNEWINGKTGKENFAESPFSVLWQFTIRFFNASSLLKTASSPSGIQPVGMRRVRRPGIRYRWAGKFLIVKILIERVKHFLGFLYDFRYL